MTSNSTANLMRLSSRCQGYQSQGGGTGWARRPVVKGLWFVEFRPEYKMINLMEMIVPWMVSSYSAVSHKNPLTRIRILSTTKTIMWGILWETVNQYLDAVVCIFWLFLCPFLLWSCWGLFNSVILPATKQAHVVYSGGTGEVYQHPFVSCSENMLWLMCSF